MGQLASGAFDGSGTGVFPGGGNERTVICAWDFAVQGGAVSNIVIGKLPNGAVVTGGWLDVETIVVGAGATAGIDGNATSDIVTAAALAGAPWTTTGRKVLNPLIQTPSTWLTMTADRNVQLAITAAPLTAGKFKLYLIVQNAN